MVFNYRIWCLERIPLWTAECRWCFHLVSWFIVFAVSICNPCGWDGSPNLMVKAGWANPQHSATLVRNHNMAVLAVFPPWVFLNITTFPTFKQWPANLGQTQMLGVISSQCNLFFRGNYCCSSVARWTHQQSRTRIYNLYIGTPFLVVATISWIVGKPCWH